MLLFKWCASSCAWVPLALLYSNQEYPLWVCGKGLLLTLLLCIRAERNGKCPKIFFCSQMTNQDNTHTSNREEQISRKISHNYFWSACDRKIFSTPLGRHASSWILSTRINRDGLYYKSLLQSSKQQDWWGGEQWRESRNACRKENPPCCLVNSLLYAVSKMRSAFQSKMNSWWIENLVQMVCHASFYIS